MKISHCAVASYLFLDNVFVESHRALSLFELALAHTVLHKMKRTKTHDAYSPPGASSLFLSFLSMTRKSFAPLQKLFFKNCKGPSIFEKMFPQFLFVLTSSHACIPIIRMPAGKFEVLLRRYASPTYRYRHPSPIVSSITHLGTPVISTLQASIVVRSGCSGKFNYYVNFKQYIIV